jgi:hypothetical protein
MNKIAVLAIAAMLAATGGVSYAAKPTVAIRSSAPVHVFIPKKAKPLVNQTKGSTGNGIVSQNFESTFAQYDAADSDAFTVPQGSTWTVTSVVAGGVYFNGSGPATGEDVTFYANKKGAPGKAIKACTYKAVKGKDSSGTFTIPLATACSLKAGTYWVSVVADLAFSVGGEWGWEDATETGPAQADWENPGGGFAIGCTKWTPELTCIANGQANGKYYELLGTKS